MCNYILIGIAIAIVVIATALTAIIVHQNSVHRKKLLELTRYQINVTSSIDATIPEILDLIIQESFSDYKIKFLIPLNEGYINNDREAEIRKDLVSMVTTRISNAALAKLSLFYNIENIAEVIADKIYILIMNYVIEHNSQLGEE